MQFRGVPVGVHAYDTSCTVRGVSFSACGNLSLTGWERAPAQRPTLCGLFRTRLQERCCNLIVNNAKEDLLFSATHFCSVLCSKILEILFSSENGQAHLYVFLFFTLMCQKTKNKYNRLPDNKAVLLLSCFWAEPKLDRESKVEKKEPKKSMARPRTFLG